MVGYDNLPFDHDWRYALEHYAKTAAVGYRGAISYVLASSAFRKGGDSEKAKAIVAEGRKKYPSDKDLLLELVNINIDAGDAAGADGASLRGPRRSERDRSRAGRGGGAHPNQAERPSRQLQTQATGPQARRRVCGPREASPLVRAA